MREGDVDRVVDMKKRERYSEREFCLLLKKRLVVELRPVTDTRVSLISGSFEAEFM